MIRLLPKFAEVYSGPARAHLGRKDFDRAIRDADEAIRLGQQPSSDYLLRGLIYLEMKAFDRAFSDANEAIRRDPADWVASGSEAHPQLAGRPRRWDRRLQPRTRTRPRRFRAFGDRGSARLLQVDLALADYDRAIALDPRNPSLRLNRSQCRFQKNDLAALWTWRSPSRSTHDSPGPISVGR